uniref:Leucine rich repeat containing 53 n=2 Tax=Suricata suricatta TaxID=37032 RepID=A0A673UBL4_SURSU
MLRGAAACPASCAVCARDVTLCHQLTYIVAAPVTTRVLIITDGYLSTIESTNLSLLFNLALLSLSRNGIEDVREDALHGLSTLRTLLLEHNRISSSSLTDHTFSRLHSLQVLALSNNALRTLQGSWFRNTQGLTRLQLDGNQITNLTDSSFGGTKLHSLRHLDLSNNFISYIGKDAFQPLPQLQEVDLSRNRLAHMPDVFTPLKQLILLSLDKNQWSCSCDLYPLARFLRNYVKSSARMLRNAKDLNCQLSATAEATAKSMLKLSENNCDSKVSNLTLVLKDRSSLLPGQDVALLTVLGFAGAVGLTCLGLVVFNWKLQQGKANEHTSENLCCRTFDESLCAHEARNYHTKGYCNCHLTQENEIKVMSIVGSRKETPLLQENRHQAALASESTALDGSFRNLKGRDRGADSTFFCFGGRLPQSGCSQPPGTVAAFNEASLLTRYCPKRVKKLRNHEPGEVQPQSLPQHVTRTIDINSDTFSRRYATSGSALARESLEKHLTNESWQPPIEKKDNGLQPHRQRHFITGSSSKLCEPDEHCEQKIVQKHRSKYHDPCGLLKQSMPRYFQPNNSLICKYVPCDQFRDYVKEEKPNHQEHSKSKKEQIQINSAIEKFLMNEDKMELSRLSSKIKKTYSPKRVSFCHPDLLEKNSLEMSSKTSPHWKQQKNQSSHLTNLDLRKCGNLQEGHKEEKWLADPQILKKKRTNQTDLKGKIKKQNSRIKLNLHRFRKVKVHPEKSLPERQKKCKHILLPPNKLSKASQKEASVNLVSSADFPQQPESNNHVRLIAKSVSLKHAPKQTPHYKKNTKKTPLLSANDLPLVNQSSTEGNHRLNGLIPASSPSTSPQPTSIKAEHRPSSSQFSTARTEGATPLALEVPGYLPATWENIGGDVLPPCSTSGTDQEATELTQHMEQDKPKTIELNQFSLSLGNQTQLVGVHKTDIYEKQTLDQSQTLKHVEQHSSHKQLRNEEKTLMTKPKISHRIVESCIMYEGHDVRKNLFQTESCDSSLIPSETEAKDDLTLIKTNSIPYQNRTEIPKDISTSLGTQAIWNLTNSGKKEIDSTHALPRVDGTEALEIKTLEKKEKKMLNESEANSSTLTRTSQMTLKGSKREMHHTWENGKSEKHTLYDSSSVEATITATDLSITCFPETENRPSCSEINSNMQDLGDIPTIQPDKDNNAHKEGTVRMEIHEVLSSLSELKEVNFETKSKVSLIPRRMTEAENSAPKPILYPPSADYVNTSPLEA